MATPRWQMQELFTERSKKIIEKNFDTGVKTGADSEPYTSFEELQKAVKKLVDAMRSHKEKMAVLCKHKKYYDTKTLESIRWLMNPNIGEDILDLLFYIAPENRSYIVSNMTTQPSKYQSPGLTEYLEKEETVDKGSSPDAGEFHAKADLTRASRIKEKIRPILEKMSQNKAIFKLFSECIKCMQSKPFKEVLAKEETIVVDSKVLIYSPYSVFHKVIVGEFASCLHSGVRLDKLTEHFTRLKKSFVYGFFFL